MSGLAKGSYFWRSATQGMRRTPFVHFIAVTTIGIALFSTGLARGVDRLLDTLLAAVGSEVEMTVYLAPDAEPAVAQELADALAKRTGGAAEVVPKEVALGRLADELGELGSALTDLPENPLPLTVEVKIPPAARSPELLGELAQKTRRLPMVTGVDWGEEAVTRLSAIARALRLAGLAAFAIVVLATVVITSATLQLAIYARREEIEIQKLVGATDRFVKAPFLIEGLLQGVLGTAVALLGLAIFAHFAGPELRRLFAFLAGPMPAPGLVSLRLGLELLAVGCTLGLGGSFLAVGRFLRV